MTLSLREAKSNNDIVTNRCENIGWPLGRLVVVKSIDGLSNDNVNDNKYNTDDHNDSNDKMSNNDSYNDSTYNIIVIR